MKFFIDTANQEEIEEAASLGILDGVTTNPTLLGREMERTGQKPEKILKKICEMVDGPVNAEGISTDSEGIIADAKKLSRIDENITIKIPMTKEGIKATRTLTQQSIKVNVTLVFSPNQALLAAKAGADYVSPFIGRLDDAGHVGMDLVRQMVTIYENYEITTEIIVASIRHPVHVVEAALAGADICTIPFSVIDRMFRHPLTDVGVDRFIKDWERARGANG
jgi:transaldolase